MANDLHELADRLDRLSSREIAQGIELAAERFALKTEDLARRLMQTRLKPRSGRLIGSLRHTVERSGKTVTATVSSGGNTTDGPVAYATIHEYGGRITPKAGKYLRLPLPPALTARGVDKMSGVSLRNNDDYQFIPRKGRDPLLMHVPSGQPHYVLKRSVTIPPRPTLGPAARFAQRSLIDELETIVDIVGRP